MIHGHNPSGYFVTADGDGHRIEGETRQCIHCLFTWEYKPGSKIQRGYCLKCGGFICARAECMAEQLRFIEMMRVQYNQTRSCVPFEEWNSRLKEKISHKLPIEPGLTVTESGLIVPCGLRD